jgi:phosphatidylethanolamine/phosphatidyl-N-methylethanolamine N-methyltransferase
VVAVISKSAVLKAYRAYAPLYDFAFGRALDAGRAALANAVQMQAPRQLLEVGVGTGLALHRYPANMQICGLDLSPEMLARARQRVHERQLGDVSLICADAEQLPFADNSFDCITLPYVLSVTPDPQALLAEVRRVCRAGGHIYVLNHFSGAGPWRWAERLLAPVADRVGFRSTLPMDATLDSAEWTRLQVQDVNLLGLSKLVVLKNAGA